jgi:hypothetical protein
LFSDRLYENRLEKNPFGADFGLWLARFAALGRAFVFAFGRFAFGLAGFLDLALRAMLASVMIDLMNLLQRRARRIGFADGTRQYRGRYSVGVSEFQWQFEFKRGRRTWPLRL